VGCLSAILLVGWLQGVESAIPAKGGSPTRSILPEPRLVALGLFRVQPSLFRPDFRI